MGYHKAGGHDLDDYGRLHAIRPHRVMWQKPRDNIRSLMRIWNEYPTNDLLNQPVRILSLRNEQENRPRSNRNALQSSMQTFLWKAWIKLYLKCATESHPLKQRQTPRAGLGYKEEVLIPQNTENASIWGNCFYGFTHLHLKNGHHSGTRDENSCMWWHRSSAISTHVLWMKVNRGTSLVSDRNVI